MTGLIADFLPALRDAARPVPDRVTDGAGRPARLAHRREPTVHSRVLCSPL